MHLKNISLLLLILLLSGCGSESSPPSAENNSMQKIILEETEKTTSVKTISKRKEEGVDFAFQDNSITFPDGVSSNAKFHTLCTEGSVENEELQLLIDLIEKSQIHDQGIIKKENSYYTGTSISFSISNNKMEYGICIDLREGNICNLHINSGNADLKTYYVDSADVSDSIKKIVSYEVINPECLEKVKSIEFAQTFQSAQHILDELYQRAKIFAVIKPQGQPFH